MARNKAFNIILGLDMQGLIHWYGSPIGPVPVGLIGDRIVYRAARQSKFFIRMDDWRNNNYRIGIDVGPYLDDKDDETQWRPWERL